VIDALHRLDAGSGDDRDAAPEFIVEGKDRQRRESSAEPAEDRSNAFGEDHRLHYAIAWAAAQAATRPTGIEVQAELRVLLRLVGSVEVVRVLVEQPPVGGCG
jgi:hypothetical protein